MTEVLRARGVGVRRGRTQVVHDVDLHVASGEIVALLGPNGAGKSTLLAALSGLVASTGSIERPARTATVLQSAGLARRSVRANVELALAWSGAPRSARRPRVEQALQLMRAEHLADVPADTLSGGERRRVHLARAVAVAPELMLLDEPFDGLDPHTHVALRDDLAQALRASSSAVLVVLHDRADAWAMADRIVVLVDGTVQADGPPQRILDDPPTADVARFLGYDGQLRYDDRLLLTRPHHVHLADDGARHGTVARIVAVQDGRLVQIASETGTVWTLQAGVPFAPLDIGSVVSFDVDGGKVLPSE